MTLFDKDLDALVVYIKFKHLHEKKNREVCIKARSPPISLPFKDKVTEQRNGLL